MSMTISVGDDRDDSIDIDDDLLLDSGEDDGGDDRTGRDRADSDARQKGRSSEGDSDDEDDEDDDRSPEELKAEIKRLRNSLAKSNSTGLRRRNQLKELRKASAVLAGNDDSDDDDDDSDDEAQEKPKSQQKTLDARAVQKRIERAKQQERARLEAEHTRDLIDTRAESALSKAGADDKAIRLLKRELDYDDLELLKDRTVDGLEEEIDRLKGEFPNLFRGGKANRRRINGGDDRDDGRRPKTLSTTEQQARLLRGA